MHEKTADTLDAIGSGLIHRLSCLHIGSQDRIAKSAEGHGRGHSLYHRHFTIPGHEGKAGDNRVGLPLKAGQHGQGVFLVTRFAENMMVECDYGVGANDAGVGVISGNLLCLGARHAPHKIHRCFMRPGRFIDLGRHNLEIEAQLGK